MFAIVHIVTAILHALIRQPKERGVLIGVNTFRSSESLLVIPRIMRALVAAAPLRRFKLSRCVWLASVHSLGDFASEAAACGVSTDSLYSPGADDVMLITADEGKIDPATLAEPFDVAFVELADEDAARRAAKIARVVVVVSRNYEQLNEFIDDIYQSPLEEWVGEDGERSRRVVGAWKSAFNEEERIEGLLDAVGLWEEEAELTGETQPKLPHNQLVQLHADALANSSDFLGFLEHLEPKKAYPMQHLLYYARYDQLEPEAKTTLVMAQR